MCASLDPWSSRWPLHQDQKAPETPEKDAKSPSPEDVSTATPTTSPSADLSDEHINATMFDNVVLIDWSRAGFSAARHVDFETRTLPPSFKIGQRLGGTNGSDVRLADCFGTHLAMKTYRKDQRHQEQIRSEINIVKRLRHHHVIELTGSMSWVDPSVPGGPVLSALFWPVASCDLQSFIDSVDCIVESLTCGNIQESATERDLMDEGTKTSMKLLRRIVCSDMRAPNQPYSAGYILARCMRRLYASFGCLADALSYIHQQKVSHKDIKPSNILIYPNATSYISTEHNPDGEKVTDGIRITDFDGAKDLSQLDDTCVDHGFRTRVYASPETHAKGESGRAADVFSMGCVYLELIALTTAYSVVRPGASPDLGAYISQQNIRKRLDDVHDGSYAGLVSSGRHEDLINSIRSKAPSDTTNRLLSVIRSMLARRDPQRPRANRVLIHVSVTDKLRPLEDSYSLFGQCCTGLSFSKREAESLSQALMSDKHATLTSGESSLWGPAFDNSVSDLQSLIVEPDPIMDVQPSDGNDEDNIIAPLDNDGRITAFTVPLVDRHSQGICWNRAGQRIDPPTIKFDSRAFDQVRNLNLCHYRYLLGHCQDMGICSRDRGFRHNESVTDRELEIFRALKRRAQPCKTDCTNPVCFSGHNCPNTNADARPEDRTKISACRYGGPLGRCRFPREMHDMDLKVVKVDRPFRGSIPYK